MSEFWMLVRLVDVLLYGAVLSGLIMHWTRLGRAGLPGFRPTLWLAFAAGAWSTIELLFERAPGGPRLLAVTAALVALSWAFYEPPVRSWWRRRRARSAAADGAVTPGDQHIS